MTRRPGSILFCLAITLWLGVALGDAIGAPPMTAFTPEWAGWTGPPDIRPVGGNLVVQFESTGLQAVRLRLLGPRGEKGAQVPVAKVVGIQRVVVPRPVLKKRSDAGAVQDGDLRLEVSVSEGGRARTAIGLVDRWLRAPRLRVFGDATLIAGGRHAPRVLVTERSGCDTGHCREAVVAGASVEFKLLVKGADAVVVWTGTTNDSGTVTGHFEVPATLGEHEIVTTVRVDGAEVTSVTPVRIVRKTRVLLTVDKPIYQPGQTIHMRMLARDEGSGRAAGGRTARFVVLDGRNNKVFQVRGETSPEGIFSARLDLATLVNTGTWRIEAWAGADKAERTVAVKNYVLPKFKVVVKPERPSWRPGEVLVGTIEADYFFGKPVGGAKAVVVLEAFDVQRVELARLELQLSAEGRGAFALKLPDVMAGNPSARGGAPVVVRVDVVDAAGQSVAARAEAVVHQRLLFIDVLPEAGRLLEGLENQVHLVVTRPDGAPVAGAMVSVATDSGKLLDGEVSTDGRGVATLRLIPTKTAPSLTFAVSAPDGATANETVLISKHARGEAQLLLRPSHHMPKAGDRLVIDVLGRGVVQHAFIDVVKDGQTVVTLAAPLADGRGSLVWDIPGELEGTLLLHAWAISERLEFIADTRPLVVRPANELRITMTADKTSWKPGEDARLSFRVTDAANRPVAAVLGIHAVDEAVFALSELNPGLAKVFFLLEQEIMKPKVEFHAFEAADLMLESSPSAAASGVLAAATMATFSHNVRTDSRAGGLTESATLWAGIFDTRAETLRRALRAWVKKAWRSPTLKEAARIFADAGIRSDLTVDWFGVPFKLDLDMDGRALAQARLRSAGRDATWGTNDDLAADLGVEQAMGPVWDWEAREQAKAGGGVLFSFGLGLVGSGAGGGGVGTIGVARVTTRVAEGRGADTQGGGDGPRLRTWFPETLLVQPSLLTDDAGRADLTVPLADSITTWRMSILASDRAGRLGSAQESLRVFQDFFVDIGFPAALTRGDEVSVPVAVYNYLPQRQSVTLELHADGGLKLLGNQQVSMDLGPNEVRGLDVALRAEAVGHGRLKVIAKGSVMADAIERDVRIAPDGFPVATTQSGYLRGPTTVAVDMPAGAVPGSQTLQVKLFPGSFSVIVDGLENMLKVPSGCFEQTSSTTYPNILVLKYLRDIGKSKPELEAKALAYLQAGWQRLVTYEVKGGGFSWFGDAPANQVLTAYGLMEFVDMNEVMAIDEAVITRTRKWLADKQQDDGSWKPDAGFLHAEAWGDIQKSSVLVTAWVAWALARSRPDRATVDAPLRKALAYLERNLGAASDSYVLSYIANAYAEALKDRPDVAMTATLDRALGRLARGAERAGAELAFPTTLRTATYGAGETATIEVTALALRAMMRAGKYLEIVKPGLGWLAGKKDSLGNWHTTQATIQVLQALVMSIGTAAESVAGNVVVKVNGREVTTVGYAADDFDVVRFVDASAAMVPGSNSVELIPSDGLEAMFQVDASSHLPWERRGPQGAQPEAFDVSVTWDRTELARNDVARMNLEVASNLAGVASMGMVDVAVPPGFEVLAEDLEAAVAAGTLQRFEITGRQIILYVAEFKPDAPFRLSWRVKARFPVRAAAGAARAWEYYDVQNAGVAPPGAVVVR